MLILRRALNQVLDFLKIERLILVEGPPRCGLSTFATQLARIDPKTFLLVDARLAFGQQVLSNPGQALRELSRGGRATIVVADNADEATARSLQATLAAGIAGERTSFVLLGRGFEADSPGARLALGPFALAEVGAGARTSHWLRGGFPEAFGAANDGAAMAWLERYADSISEERFAAAGLPWAPGRSRALLAMIAEAQGGSLNENAAARSLGVSRPTVARAVAALERAGLVRFLPSLPASGRVARSAAIYLRDSGLYHSLGGLTNVEALLGSARLAASWEGYVVEQALAVLPPGAAAARRATRDGTALELVLSRPGKRPTAVSIRWARPGAPSRSAVSAACELEAECRWLVLPEAEEREIGAGFLVVGLPRFLERIGEA